MLFFGQSLIASQRIYHDPRTRRDHGATLNAPAENSRPKHDSYFSHGRARPNAREMYAHTSFPGAHELRRPPRVRPAPTGSAAVGARVRQALLASRLLPHLASRGWEQKQGVNLSFNFAPVGAVKNCT